MTATVLPAKPVLFDLHVHLRGTLTPELARRLAQGHRVPLPDDAFDAEGAYRVGDFSDFLDSYQRIGAVVRCADDLGVLAQRYLEQAAAAGAIYVEFMLSPQHCIDNGIAWQAQVEAIAAAADACASVIDMSLIATALRHHGPDKAKWIANLVASFPHSIVRGFGLTGDEHCHEASEFAAAYNLAHEAGLGLTAHAGEWLDARSVLETINALHLTRVGHGLSVVRDSHIMADLSAAGIGFEICQSANYALGAVRQGEPHPIGALATAGCRLLLGTDDPAFFRTAIDREYQAAATLLSEQQLARITTDSIALAFCSERTRQRLRARALGGSHLVREAGVA